MSPLQVEGYAHLLGQIGNVQSTPQLETPAYNILKKTGEYEIRQYDPYLVAETNMPVGSGPAAGDGFQTLASYLFGSNNRFGPPTFCNRGNCVGPIMTTLACEVIA
jgi:hypothetical protein